MNTIADMEKLIEDFNLVLVGKAILGNCEITGKVAECYGAGQSGDVAADRLRVIKGDRIYVEFSRMSRFTDGRAGLNYWFQVGNQIWHADYPGDPVDLDIALRTEIAILKNHGFMFAYKGHNTKKDEIALD